MPRIVVSSTISAPIERCFDLARSIDFHSHSMTRSGERAVGGRMTGLIEQGEEVTWEARHMCLRQRLTSRITSMQRPHLFVDELVRGAFKSFRHEHRFEQASEGVVRVTDDFVFESPMGLLGEIANSAFLTRYMRRLLDGHQSRLKTALESDRWREFLRA